MRSAAKFGALVLVICFGLGCGGGSGSSVSHDVQNPTDHLGTDAHTGDVAVDAQADGPAHDGTVADAGIDQVGVDLGGADAVAPADVQTDMPPPLTIGNACAEPATECGTGESCILAPAAPGGYCSSPCNGPNSCPAGSACAQFPNRALCVKVCTSDSDCRQGYTCTDSAAGAHAPPGLKACAPQGNPNAQLGSACSTSVDCQTSQFCALVPGGGDTPFPGGYCTTTCNPMVADSCGVTGECVAVANPQNLLGGICAAKCNPANLNACRVGYDCVNAFAGAVTTATVCAGGNGAAALGDDCTVGSNCAPGNGFCIDEATNAFPGGYCSQGCVVATSGSCGANGVCVASPAGAAVGICAQSCTNPVDCKNGYDCVAAFIEQTLLSKVCAPGVQTAHTGDACTTSGDCLPGIGACVTEAGSALPGGYCTQPCDPTAMIATCQAGDLCVHFGGPATQGSCIKTCNGDQCRPGYVCTTGFGDASTGATTVCSPGHDLPASPDGAPCVNDGDCTVGTQTCLLPAGGLPHGYCSHQCNPQTANSCGASSSCLATSATDATQGVCLANCTDDSTCTALRGPNGGTYGCVNLQTLTHKVCLPFTATAKIGDPCTGLADCPQDGFCIGAPNNPEFANGYCSSPCQVAMAGACGAGNSCLPTDMMGNGVCVLSCSHNADCRSEERYECIALQPGLLGCFPSL